MSSLRGITEIIGVRAVIIDVRQYLQSGRDIERANERIAASSTKIQTASISSSRATIAAIAAQTKAEQAAITASIDLARAKDLEAKAQANAAAAAQAATGRAANGQFLSKSTVAAAAAQQAKLEADAAAALEKSNASRRVAIELQGTATAAALVKEAADKRANLASITGSEASARAIAANIAARQAEIASTIALTRAVEAEALAEEHRRTIPALSSVTNVAGQPVNFEANQAALAEQTKLDKEAKKARDEFNASQKEAANLSKTAAAATVVEAAAIGRDEEELARAARNEEALTKAKRERLNTATTGIALVGTAAIGITAGAAIKSAADYQQSLSKIDVLTEATDQQTAQLGQTFLKLSTQIPVSAADLAQAAYLALSSGIKDTNEALTLTTQTAKTAVAAQTDIKDVIGAVITVLNAYPKGVIDASKANDILFAGVKVGRAEFNDFAGSIGKLLPVAAALGVPFDQVTAALATMTNAGINAEEASTALRAILNDLIRDSSSKQAADALQAIGLSADQLYESIRTKGLAATLQNLFELFGKNAAAIEPLIPNIRGMVGLLALAQNGGKGFADNLKVIDNSLGIVDQSFEKTRGNVANLSKIVSNELNVALIEIGTAVLPTIAANLQDLIKYIEANKESIAKFISEGLQLLIATIKTLVEGIGVAIRGFGLLKGALSSIVGSAEADKAALALIGLGLAWALPGGPYLKGLGLVLLALGQIHATSQSGEGTLKTVIRAAAPFVGGLVTSGAAIAATGGAAVSAAPATFAAGAIGTSILTDLLLGKPGEKGAGIKGKDDISDVTDLINKLNAPIKELGDSSLPSFDTGIKSVDKSAQKAAEDLKKLAEAFKTTSEVAGQVESLTVAFKKFGTINKDLADAAKLSASQAGEVQGFDAVVNARKREQEEIFNNIEAIAAITSAWQRSTSVGKALALDLAQASLEASQKALSDVFSRPTREVADLNVGLARQQLTTAQLQRAADPRLASLNSALDAINKQISETNKANSLANRAAERAIRDQQRAQKDQQKAAQDQLDALKQADLEAQIAAERQLAALQKLIDANNKAASDLQKAFLKSNEDLQVQINTAIGKGDRQTALDLVDQQRKATKAYEANQKAIQDSTEGLTTQQKIAQEAEAERKRQEQLAEAALQKQQKAQQKQQDSTDALTQSLDDAKAAQDDQTQALNDSKDAIQAQIDALQKPIDASKQQEKVIQDQIGVYEAQTNVLKALGVAADHTLLTQQQQAQAADHFTKQIDYASGQAKLLADNFYAFIPGTQAANAAAETLKGAMDSVKTKIDTVLNPGFDAAAAHANLLATANGDLVTSTSNAATSIGKTAAQIDLAFEQIKKNQAENQITPLSGLERLIPNPAPGSPLDNLRRFLNPTGARGFALGGFTGSYQGPVNIHPNELILPLSQPSRVAELMTQIPPAITAALSQQRGGQAIFAPNISVSGETLDTMEATAIRAVQRAFRDARTMSGRSGGLITQGLGPGH